MLNIACLLSGKSSAHDCYPTDKPSVSAVLFGCHGINLLKNLVSRELLRILENFHFSISISKHFDFTFHFSKKSESILISLCTSRKRVKAFFFHFALLEKEWKLFIFTFHFSNFKNPLSLVPVIQVTVLTHSDLIFSLWCSPWFLDWPIRMHVSVPNVVTHVLDTL